MDQLTCGCCSAHRPVSHLYRRRRALRGSNREFSLASDAAIRHPLCATCLAWMSNLVAHAGVAVGSAAPLLGLPGAGGRVHVFPDQCHLCKEMVGAQAVVVDAVALVEGKPGMDAALVCDGCDIWLAGLAADGKSARGEAEREIDGVYGMWPHPNLRSLAVEVAVNDDAAATAIRDACRRMGVSVIETYDPTAVLFLRATETGSASAVLSGGPSRRPGVIVLSSLATKEDLLGCLELGASTWLTVPATPQQVSAALTRVLRRPVRALRWDRETALPVLDLQHLDRPALAIIPSPGVTPFEAAWFARRVSRGYDDLGVHGARIILVPRIAIASFDRVVERVSAALVGKCFVSPLDAAQPGQVNRRLLEAAG